MKTMTVSRVGFIPTVDSRLVLLALLLCFGTPARRFMRVAARCRDGRGAKLPSGRAVFPSAIAPVRAAWASSCVIHGGAVATDASPVGLVVGVRRSGLVPFLLEKSLNVMQVQHISCKNFLKILA